MGDSGICANSWLLCCDKYCHFIYVTTLRLHYEVTEVRLVYVLFSTKYILFTWHFIISQSMNAPDRGKGKIIPGCFYSPKMWESGGREKKKNKKAENYMACLHMSNLKYCREPVSKRCFPVYPFSQTIPLQWKSMEYNHWHKNLLCSSHFFLPTVWRPRTIYLIA